MSQPVYVPKASTHANVTATYKFKVKNITHISAGLIESNIKQTFNSIYLI